MYMILLLEFRKVLKNIYNLFFDIGSTGSWQFVTMLHEELHSFNTWVHTKYSDPIWSHSGRVTGMSVGTVSMCYIKNYMAATHESIPTTLTPFGPTEDELQACQIVYSYFILYEELHGINTRVNTYNSDPMHVNERTLGKPPLWINFTFSD